MAIVTAQAKLYNGIRLLCVDKNITANLTSTFTVGNFNRPLQPEEEFEISSGILGFKVLRTAAGCEGIAGLNLVDERYKTYGGGNNIITPQGTDNQPNWKVNSSLSCVFPTYVRFDVEALGAPEGTDIIIQLEEGFVFEGDYPGTERKALPKVDNLIQFRTPKKFVAFPTSQFNLINPGEVRKSFIIDAGALFTPLTIARANKVGFIEFDAFTNLAAGITYTVGAFAELKSRFGPIAETFDNPLFDPQGTPVLEGNGFPLFNPDGPSLGFWPAGFPGITRIRQGESAFETSQFTLPNIPDGRIRLGGVLNFVNTAVMVINPVKTTEIVLDNQGFGSMSIQAVKTAVYNAEVVSTAGLINDANYIIVSSTADLNLETTAGLLNPKIDGYPWDFQKNITAFTGYNFSTGDRNNFILRLNFSNNTNFNLSQSSIVNITTEQIITVNGQRAGSTSNKFLTAQGDRFTPSARSFSIRNYSGSVIGTIGNTNLRVDYGGPSGTQAQIGSNFAYITYTQLRSGLPAVNNIEIVNLQNNSRSEFLSNFNDNTVTGGADSNNFIAFKVRNNVTLVSTFTLRSKDTNNNVRTVNLTQAQGGDFSEIVATSDEYFALRNPGRSGVTPSLTVYRIDTGQQVYQRTGSGQIDVAGLDNEYLYRINSGNLEVINLITGLRVQTINNIDSFRVRAGSRILLGLGNINIGTTVVYEDSTNR